ncbi:MAG: 50S ribosomal protein L30 [Candidatus Bathyarchaeota archaeon]
MEEKEQKCIVAVRVRGTVNVRREVKETLSMIHLNKVNHATLIPLTPSYRGMLHLAKDYITWGEISAKTLSHLINKRGEVKGSRKLSEEYLKKYNFSSVSELAEALCALKVKFAELPELKPVFRLHPPSKGFKKSLKHGFSDGGELGYRGEKINELIKRML